MDDFYEQFNRQLYKNAPHSAINGADNPENWESGTFTGYLNVVAGFQAGGGDDYLKYDKVHGVRIQSSQENALVIKYGSDILLEHGGDIKFTSVTAPTACTATLVATDVGNVDAGAHIYKITYVNESGETELGTVSNTVTTDATHLQVDLTAIPVSTSGSVTDRKIYRTKAGGNNYYLLTTISNNTTTTYTDNVADASLTGGVANTRDNNSFGKIIVDDITGIIIAKRNTFIGQKAGIANTTGYYNTSCGIESLFSNTTGYGNTASGTGSLNRNTTGYENVANGVYSLLFNTTGYYNVANGSYSLYENTSGYRNVAVGHNVLHENTTGYYNTSCGFESLFSNIDGNLNTSIGSLSLNKNTSGSYNTASGYAVLNKNTTGSRNTSMGYTALFENITGSGNIAFGYYSGAYETGSDAFYINNQDRTDTAGDKAKSILYGVMASTAAAQKLTINALLNLSVTKTPATAAAAGTTGDVAWDASYIYICTATDTWKRVAIASW